MVSGPKVLTVDLETSPLAAYTWRMYGEQNISLDQLIDPGGVIMVGYKWRHEKQAHTLTIPEHGVAGMARQTKALLDEADTVVTWNGISFDEPHLRGLLFQAGEDRPAPYVSLDLYRIVRREFREPSNKLDYWAQYLGVGSKIKHAGFNLWVGCMDGDEKAWDTMAKYCRQDVTLTEKILDRFEQGGWLTTAGLPHRSMYGGAPDGCPVCGSAKYQRRGKIKKKQLSYQRFQCQDCGQWFQGTKAIAPGPTTRVAR
jgi:predicted RNA-binding Zn-ribbon protein involved in translation (DUF1610 family)